MQTQAVIFDLDGLLVDTEPLHRRVFNATLARHGVDYEIQEEEFGRAFVGISQCENSAYLITRFGMRASPDESTRERVANYERIIADPKNLTMMPGAPILVVAESQMTSRLNAQRASFGSQPLPQFCSTNCGGAV